MKNKCGSFELQSGSPLCSEQENGVFLAWFNVAVERHTHSWLKWLDSVEPETCCPVKIMPCVVNALDLPGGASS